MDASIEVLSSTIARGSDGLTSRTSMPVVRTKVAMPAPAAAYIDRGRLGALLDPSLRDGVRLTLLSAPPGYGKTLAVAGWLESRGLPRAWLSLDAADSDLARFSRYLFAALGGVRPGAVDAAGDLFGPGSPPDPEVVGATLLDEMAASDEPFALVLDDYHLVASESVQRLVRFLIERGPPFVHPLLLTREDPPLPLARLRAHGRLVELRGADLRCTAEEASAYLSAAGAALPPSLSGRLVELTEGWIAGLQLAAISLRGHPDPARVVESFGGGQRFVFDYLADEVLGGVDADLRRFLVEISIAERFTVELCQVLTGREDASSLLGRAERANLFLVPLDVERRWYRYHGLFADYLGTQLTDAERRALHGRAADWFATSGLAPEAVDHALAAGSSETAAHLVAMAARPAFEAGELEALLRWLDALPPERVAASADLVSLHAWALFYTGRVAAAIAQAERHLASCGERGEAEGRLLALVALMGTVTRPDAGALAAEALGLLGDDELFRSTAHQAAGLASLAQGDVVQAVETLREAFAAALRAGHPMAVVPAVNPLCHALDLAGGRDEAEAICRRVLREHADPQGRPRPIAWSVRVVLGIVRYEAGDLAEGRRELEGGFEDAGRMGVGRPMLGWAVPYLALAREATGSTDAALEALQVSARDASRTGAALPATSAETEARIRLMRGDLAAAARWADHAAPEAPADSPLLDVMRRSIDVSVARVRLAQGRTDEASGLLARARAVQEASGAVADLISIGVLEAAAAARAGRTAAALRSLEQAVELAAPGHYVRRLLDDGGGVSHLLPRVREAAPAFVDELIAGFAAEPPAATPSREARGPAVSWDMAGRPVEALTARESEVLRLMARGASNADIAEGLTVSLGTAKWHVGHVLAKLGATSRTQALVRAQELGLV